jgi:hypothetical protein
MPNQSSASTIKIEIINNERCVDKGGMAGKVEEEKVLLTLTNIRYLVEGLDALLMMDLDGEKRAKVIRLRDELVSQLNSIFNDYS